MPKPFRISAGLIALLLVGAGTLLLRVSSRLSVIEATLSIVLISAGGILGFVAAVRNDGRVFGAAALTFSFPMWVLVLVLLVKSSGLKIDPYILAFSALTVLVTIWMGFWSARRSKTTSDFFVAGRSVSVGWNASAISGEYLSAASFMGVAGMVMSSGYDALWYPVCYACGYLFLLLFIAGPLRRFGAYTIPDFAEGRFDSPLFRKIAVVFVLFIGFFYTMPQMKGAGTTLSYIFQDLDFRGTALAFLAPHEKGEALKGLHYGVGVFLVGAVITLNVALGGMKGITLVQAFQYWAKMFAISVPIFVLMAVYGHYGRQVGVNGNPAPNLPRTIEEFRAALGEPEFGMFYVDFRNALQGPTNWATAEGLKFRVNELLGRRTRNFGKTESIGNVVADYSAVIRKRVSAGSSWRSLSESQTNVVYDDSVPRTRRETIDAIESLIRKSGGAIFPLNATNVVLLTEADLKKLGATNLLTARLSDNDVRSQFHEFSVNNHSSASELDAFLRSDVPLNQKAQALAALDAPSEDGMKTLTIMQAIGGFNYATRRTVWVERSLTNIGRLNPQPNPAFGTTRTREQGGKDRESFLLTNGVAILPLPNGESAAVPLKDKDTYIPLIAEWPATERSARSPLPANAPGDETWLNPFGPLTTKAAKAAKPTLSYTGQLHHSSMEMGGNTLTDKARFQVSKLTTSAKGADPGGQKPVGQVLNAYAGASAIWNLSSTSTRVELLTSEALQTLSIPTPPFQFESRSDYVRKAHEILTTNGITVLRDGNTFTAFLTKEATVTLIDPRPYSLLYTYSLIIALVCGTAGLPHILVRFYTNPDGVAAKRTTMWVMILIGVFYLFPPVFGVMGRNLMPSLYEGAGAKGTDKVVLELPRVLERQANDEFRMTNGQGAAPADSIRHSTFDISRKRSFPWGSILSGITCAGAFAAFMSTFSGLLVSMTGAMAHDVYGRIFRPKSTPQQRLLAFKIAAVGLGAGAILLGFFVENFEINKMVGWAFAIAATSYFPLLFLSTWWRGITMKGAATGMLVGGTLSLVAIASTMFADQAAWAAGLKDYYAAHPLMRILAEQPAIWALPLAMGLMYALSKLTAKDIPADIRMKMLVLHAPEKLGLKQEYIQEHPQGH